MQYSYRDLWFGACQMVKMEKDNTTLEQAKTITRDVMQEVANMRNWVFLQRDWFINSVANQYEYTLPNTVDLITFMYSYNHDRAITSRDAQLYDQLNPNCTSSGDPYHYMIRGSSGVIHQPYSTVAVVSDSASDTMVLTLKGWSYGRFVSESITLTGTTAVDSSNKYLRIHSAELASAATGTVTATSNGGNVTNFTVAAAGTEPSSYTDPSDTVTIVSNSTTDTSPKKLRIIGFSTQASVNIQIRESIVLNGVTGVASSNRYNQILGINKDVTVGTIKATATGIDETIWQGAPLEKSPEWILLTLVPAPSDSDDTILVRFKQKLTPLTHDDDPIAPFPQKFAPGLKHLIASRLWDFMGHQGDKAQKENFLWEQTKKEMVYEDDQMRGTLTMIGTGESPLDAYGTHPYGNFSVSS